MYLLRSRGVSLPSGGKSEELCWHIIRVSSTQWFSGVMKFPWEIQCLRLHYWIFFGFKGRIQGILGRREITDTQYNCESFPQESRVEELKVKQVVFSFFFSLQLSQRSSISDRSSHRYYNSWHKREKIKWSKGQIWQKFWWPVFCTSCYKLANIAPLASGLIRKWIRQYHSM